jgi:hypothetical protein
VAFAAGITTFGLGCGSGVISGGGGTGGSGDNALINDALSFEGSISGQLSDSQSTRESTGTTSLAQNLPDFDTNNTCVRFKDLEGNDLLDENGQPIEEVDIEPDGTFRADGLPVGSDFTVCGDIGKDGTCDMESCVNIPSASGSTDGALEDVVADPLTTTILAKLRDLIAETGIDIGELPISPVAVVTRITEAYTHLFEESGIEHELTLEDIESLTANELAALFDEAIPSGAQSGMRLVEGNLDVARGRDVNSVALGAAKVFVRAGFPIIDGPGSVDLSALAELEGVEQISKDELFNDGRPFLDDFADVNDDLPIEPAQFGGDSDDFTVYISVFAEPDRNFDNAEGEFASDEGPQLPPMHDYVLERLARIQLNGQRITMGDLYDLLTSVDRGLGARLTYFIFDPNFFGPPLNVFETEDGAGKAINLERLFNRFGEAEFDIFNPDDFERQESRFRQFVREALEGTVAPSFDRFFGAFSTDRVESVNALSERIRSAKVHLPFSRSGPSEFYVVADGDPFLSEDGGPPVTVDAQITPNGEILSIVYNESGEGKFYLGFTNRTDTDGIVKLIVAETGRILHSDRGPSRVDMNDENLFASVNGQPFIELVGDAGLFYPGTHVSVIKSDFMPGPSRLDKDRFGDGQTDGPFDGGPFDGEAGGGGSSNGDFDPAPVEGDRDGDGIPDDFLDEENPFFEGDEANDPGDLPGGTTDAAGDEGAVDEDPPATQTFEGDRGGVNQQIFVLATGLGSNAAPLRVDYDRASGVATVTPGGRHLLMFLPDSHETGVFALFNEQTGRPSTREDPDAFFRGPMERPDRFEDFFNEFDDFESFEDFDGIEDFIGDFIGELPPLEDLPPFDGEFPPFDEEFPPFDEEFPPFDEEFPPMDGELPPPDGTIPPPEDMVDQPPMAPEDMGDPMNPDDPNNVVDPAQVDEVIDENDAFEEPEEIDGISDDIGDDFNDFNDFDDLLDEPLDIEFEFDELEAFEGFGGFIDQGLVLIDVESQLVGIDLGRLQFTFVFGTDVPNPGYNPDGDPYFDDVNGNEQQDADEPTAPFRPTLFDPDDWRSTDIRLYYRRVDNNESVSFENINFDSPTPQALDGVELVPRTFHPRANAFRFSRPNTSVNLLTAFLPADFFDGTNGLDRDTRLNPFAAIAVVNLVMDQIFNVEARIDADGLGPLRPRRELADAHLFVVPLDDPFVLMIDGFVERASERVASAP